MGGAAYFNFLETEREELEDEIASVLGESKVKLIQNKQLPVLNSHTFTSSLPLLPYPPSLPLSLTDFLPFHLQVLILRNHGAVAMGASVEEAFCIAHRLVKACDVQVSLYLQHFDL